MLSGREALDVFDQKIGAEAHHEDEAIGDLALRPVDQDQVAAAQLWLHAVAPDRDHGEVGRRQAAPRSKGTTFQN